RLRRHRTWCRAGARSHCRRQRLRRRTDSGPASWGWSRDRCAKNRQPFCAPSECSLTGRDAQHLHRGEVLAVTALAVGVLAALLLEGDDLLALAVADDLALNRGALDQRR